MVKIVLDSSCEAETAVASKAAKARIAAQLRLSIPAAPGTRALASRHWNPAEEPSLATSVLCGQHLRPHPLMESWHPPHTTCVEASAS